MRSLHDLIPKLMIATNQGKVKWEPHQFGGFTCSLGSHTIRTWEWRSEDSETSGVSANLLDEKNGSTLLDAIVADEYDSKYAEVLELHSAARRSALNVEQVISDIENELDNL